jgi:hypothetical protein
MFSLLLGCWPAKTPCGATILDAKADFAQALDVRTEAVRDFLLLDMPPGSALSVCWLGIVDAGEDSLATLVPVSNRDGRQCPGQPLRLTMATEFISVSVIDLHERTTMDLSQIPEKQPRVLQQCGRQSRPALLVRSRLQMDTSAKREHMVLCSLWDKPQLLLQEETSSLLPTGGGFESYELSLTPNDDGWPLISILQTTVPHSGEEPFMPGPPLLMRYRYDGEMYQRVDE